MDLFVDSLSITVNEKVIEAETNDARFEEFCREAVSALEGGATILSTSLSWDLGRDGVGVGRAQGIYLCASLRDDVDGKALSDIQRITSTTKGIKQLYFCSSSKLSEHARQKIESALLTETDNRFSISCLGAAQLVEISTQRAPSALERHYGAEIQNTLRAIKPDLSSEAEVHGLRLALIASAGEDSSAIRNELYGAALLDTLRDGEARTLTTCARHLSESLKLQRNIAEGVVEFRLGELCSQGHIDLAGKLYQISTAGLADVEKREAEATDRLLAGRQAVRTAIQQAIGSEIIDDHFNTMWSVFEDKMAHYFISRGHSLIGEVSEYLGDEASVSAGKTASVATPVFIDDVAKAVAATSSHVDQRVEIAQAIRDLFTNRTSIATDFLVRLSASFLAVCALGLEHTSGAALEKLFSRTTLIFDTDVVLSLLGEGEPEHDAVTTITSRWTRHGGRVLISEPVLEEIAYHASIAQRDFDQVLHRLPGTAEDRLYIIENVFVRAFAEMMAAGNAKQGHWRSYINQYRGEKPYDWGNAFATLSADYAVGKLPERSSKEASLENEVRKYLAADAEANRGTDKLSNALDKANRDARLYAALVHQVRVVKAADPGATCLLVSSARRLTVAESNFHESGEPQLVVSIGCILYLLSMLPDVALGVSAMKAFLFDTRGKSFSSGLERSLIRLVRSSEEFSMPWAKRGSLMRSVREKLIAETESQGARHVTRSKLGDLEAEALTPAREDRTIQMLREALDSIAVEPKMAEENSKLRARVKELERELAKRSAPKR